MRTVAVLGRPLRADYCETYLRELEDSASDLLVIVARPDDVDLTGLTDVVVLTGLDLGDRVLEGLRARTRSGLIRWMRSGSTIGMRVERALKPVLSRARKRVSSPPSPGEAAAMEGSVASGPRNLIQLLEHAADRGEIDVIAVFDVFQLPAAMEYADGHSASVVVR